MGTQQSTTLPALNPNPNPPNTNPHNKIQPVPVALLPTDIQQNICLLSTPLTAAQQQFIHRICLKTSILCDLSKRRLSKLVAQFKVCGNLNDQYLFKEGSNASYFFIIAEGQVDVIKNGYFIRTLGVGDCFGEMALLYKIRRSTSIKVGKEYRGRNKYYVLERRAFVEAAHQMNASKSQEFIKVVENNCDFYYLTFRDKMGLAQAASKINFKANERILSKFDEPYAFFSIAKGAVQLKFHNKRAVHLKQSKTFGYFGSELSDCTAYSTTDTTTYTIGKDQVNSILDNKVKYLFLWKKAKYTLINCEQLQNVGLQKLQRILALFKFRHIKAMQPICHNYQYISKLYIFISCMEQQKNELIGAEQLTQIKRQKYLKDFMSIKSGFYAYADVIKVKKLIEQQQQPQQIENNQKYSFDLTQSQCLKVYRQVQNKPCSMLCRQDRFNMCYYLQIAESDNKQQVDHLIERSQIFKKINCILVQSFHFCYEKNNQYLLGLQFIRGTKIKQIVTKIGLIPQSISKFYIACMITIMQHLHSKGIKCLELSLDSFKVDNKGYLCLAQLQGMQIDNTFLQDKQKTEKTEKIHKSKKNLVIPEFIQNYQRVGMMAYQMLIGEDIETAGLEDKKHSYNKQLLNFPNSFKSKEGRQVIQLLVFTNQESGTNWDKIKEMPFFRGIDWSAITNRSMFAPILPGFMSFDSLQP